VGSRQQKKRDLNYFFQGPKGAPPETLSKPSLHIKKERVSTAAEQKKYATEVII
jgi:hypothetical protein